MMSEIEDDLMACTRCSTMVEEETLHTIGDWHVCEDCWDDL